MPLADVILDPEHQTLPPRGICLMSGHPVDKSQTGIEFTLASKYRENQLQCGPCGRFYEAARREGIVPIP